MRTFSEQDVMPLWDLHKFFSESEDKPLPADIDRKVADFFNEPERPYSTSLDAAYSLLDAVKPADADYLNVDFREYTRYVICDINDDYGSPFEGSCRGGKDRIAALVGATIAALAMQIEVEADNA